MERCPHYTFEEDEMFATPENALITNTEAYYNKDTELFWETAYHSDSFKEKLSRTEISFEQFKEMERQNALSSPKNQRVDRVEFTKKETINENEVYLEYRVFLKILGSEGTLHSKDDIAYMIKIGDKWLINVEPEFDPQFKEMGVI